jgi:hypothetical protein
MCETLCGASVCCLCAALDDNRMLCLPSGERIRLDESRLRLLFEVEDLAAASPATVSRCVGGGSRAKMQHVCMLTGLQLSKCTYDFVAKVLYMPCQCMFGSPVLWIESLLHMVCSM